MRKKIGSGITDSNGVASCNYTGKAVGKMNVVAETKTDDRILQSETYGVIDAIFYDKGLTGSGNHNDNWLFNGNFDLVRGTSYTTFQAGTVTYWIKPNNNSGFTGDFCIEWDNYNTSNTNQYLILSGSSDVPQSFINLRITGEYPIKITVIGTDVTVYVNNTIQRQYSINRDSNGKVFIRIQINSNGSDFQFANFKVYSI